MESQRIFGQQLTNQETKVAKLLGVGYSDKEAASILNISTRTVINHKSNIFEKLHINKVTELVIWVWCGRTNIKFDLTEIRKQAIAVFFLLIMTPGIVDVELKPRLRRVRNIKYNHSYEITA